MWKGIKKFFSDLWNSLFNNSQGPSARKLAAFTIMAVVCYIQIKFCTAEALFNLVCADLIFILLCLGLVTTEQLIRYKTGGGTVTTTVEETTAETNKKTATTAVMPKEEPLQG